MLKIEILYPELTTLYGDAANIDFLSRTAGEAEVIETHLGEKPRFLTEGAVDLIYRGTLTEEGQELMIEELRPYTEDIKGCIESGQHFLITGNALEVFGTEIREFDGKKALRTIPALGIFPYHSERDILRRYNSLYVGKYGDIDVTGFHCQFGHSYYDGDVCPLFLTEKGPGFHPEIKEEGVHEKNFMATYLVGPLLILNPPFCKALAEELGAPKAEIPFSETAYRAYEMRLREYRSKTNLSY